jgi:hypothetical protein
MGTFGRIQTPRCGHLCPNGALPDWGATICARMARSPILVGRRGLEPRTSAVKGLERCA